MWCLIRLRVASHERPPLAVLNELQLDVPADRITRPRHPLAWEFNGIKRTPLSEDSASLDDHVLWLVDFAAQHSTLLGQIKGGEVEWRWGISAESSGTGHVLSANTLRLIAKCGWPIVIGFYPPSTSDSEDSPTEEWYFSSLWGRRQGSQEARQLARSPLTSREWTGRDFEALLQNCPEGAEVTEARIEQASTIGQGSLYIETSTLERLAEPGVALSLIMYLPSDIPR